MNILDIFIAVCLLLAFLLGWRLKALTLVGLSLSLVAGIWLANHFHPRLLGLFQDFQPALRQTAAWLTLFLGSALLISLLFAMLAKAFEVIRLQWLDHLLGATLALGVMLGLLMIGMTVLDTVSRMYGWKIVEHSRLAPALIQTAQPLIHKSLDKYPRLKQSVR